MFLKPRDLRPFCLYFLYLLTGSGRGSEWRGLGQELSAARLYHQMDKGRPWRRVLSLPILFFGGVVGAFLAGRRAVAMVVFIVGLTLWATSAVKNAMNYTEVM